MKELGTMFDDEKLKKALAPQAEATSSGST